MGSVTCFGGQATATSCMTGAKALPANDGPCPALAQNEKTPMDLTTRAYIRVGLRRNEEAAKSPANHFYRGHVVTIAGRSSERIRRGVSKSAKLGLVLPEITEPLGRKFAISNRMLDVLVAEIVLQRPSIHTLIGQLEPG